MKRSKKDLGFFLVAAPFEGYVRSGKRTITWNDVTAWHGEQVKNKVVLRELSAYFFFGKILFRSFWAAVAGFNWVFRFIASVPLKEAYKNLPTSLFLVSGSVMMTYEIFETKNKRPNRPTGPLKVEPQSQRNNSSPKRFGEMRLSPHSVLHCMATRRANYDEIRQN